MKVGNIVVPTREPDFEIVGYLRRWNMPELDETGKGRTYLHQFLGPDDRHLHNHPWDFETVVLKGGYDWLFARDLDSPVERMSIREGGTFAMRHETPFHCVASPIGDTWTLVRTGPVLSRWGFIDEEPKIGRPPDRAKYIDSAAYFEKRKGGLPENIYRNGHRPTVEESLLPVRDMSRREGDARMSPAPA